MAKRDTKELILVEAFKLFTAKPYDKVTFLDIENVTKLSRGAILYHVNNKETLFKEVVDKYLFNEYSLSKYLTTDNIPSLSKFIRLQLDLTKSMKKQLQMLGIKNMSSAMVNITTDAMYFYPGSFDKAKEWQSKEVLAWKKVIENAAKKQEIREVDVESLASVFSAINYGTSYSGIATPKGTDLEVLKNNYMCIYDMVKLQTAA